MLSLLRVKSVPSMCCGCAGSIKAGCVPCSGCCVLLCALGLCYKLSVVAKCVRVAGVVKWIARDRWVRCHGSGKCHWK